MSAESNAWTPEDTNLRDILVGLYFTNQEIVRVAEQAGMNRTLLDFNGNALTVWHGVVRQAKLQLKRSALIQVALKDYPENPALQQAAQGRLNSVRGADIERDISWQPTADVLSLEKIMGEESTILPVSFLEAGLVRSQSVARIVRGDGSMGTGFLIAQNLLVTNHHVLNDSGEATAAKVQFNFQRSPNGLDLPSEQFELDPQQGFLTSSDDDWTVVRIKGNANTKWGKIELKPVTVSKQGRVIIIQHPAGGPKSIALYHNIVTSADSARVQYLTDTMPGSSGSPVFDDSWNLVAIHHSGGWLREPGSKQLLFRNEGIAVGRLIDGAHSLIS